jgi:hypothetical protein
MADDIDGDEVTNTTQEMLIGSTSGGNEVLDAKSKTSN